jgi:hypothetical protein
VDLNPVVGQTRYELALGKAAGLADLAETRAEGVAWAFDKLSISHRRRAGKGNLGFSGDR